MEDNMSENNQQKLLYFFDLNKTSEVTNRAYKQLCFKGIKLLLLI
jgi:hypothetical protein